MKCSKCGHEGKGNFKFCPKCGNSMMSAGGAEMQGIPNQNEVPAIVKKKNSSAVKAAIIATVSVASVALLTAGALFAVSMFQNPLVKLSKSLTDISDDITDIKNGSFDISSNSSYDTIKINGKFEINGSKKTAVLAVSAKQDGEKSDFGCYVTKDELAYGYMEDDYIDVDVLDSDDLDFDLESVWKMYNKEKTDYQEMAEDLGIEDDLEDYIEIKNIEKLRKKFVSNMSSSDTIKELSDVLDIEKKKGNTYSCAITEEKLMDSLDIIIAAFSDAADGLAEPELLDELDYLSENISDAFEEINYDRDTRRKSELAVLDWSYKGKRLSEIAVSADELDLKGRVNFSYGLGGKISAAEISFTFDDMKMKISVSDINSTKNAKDVISSKLYNQLTDPDRYEASASESVYETYSDEDVISAYNNSKYSEEANASAKSVFTNAQTVAQEYEVMGKVLKNGVYTSSDGSDYSEMISQCLDDDDADWAVWIDNYVIMCAFCSGKKDYLGIYPWKNDIRVPFNRIDLDHITSISNNMSDFDPVLSYLESISK